MKYPIITSSKCAEIARQLIEESTPSIEVHVEWIGHGDEIDLGPVAAVAEEITGQIVEWTDRDRDRFEGKMSPGLVAALAQVPVEILDDRGFWRYLGLQYFWEFIAWREQEPFAKGNHLRYVDASSSTESVLTRMYLRAQALGGVAHPDLAGALPRATDFWRSHVLRVRTGTAQPLTRALASKQFEDRLSSNVLRDTARRLNRLWANVELHIYDDDEAAGVIESVWPAVDGS
jgi:hypothetical protein